MTNICSPHVEVLMVNLKKNNFKLLNSNICMTERTHNTNLSYVFPLPEEWEGASHQEGDDAKDQALVNNEPFSQRLHVASWLAT